MEMQTIDLKALGVEKTVDARGTACPGPLLEAKRAVAAVKMKGIMDVLSSDSGSLEDIPMWCKKVGHDYLGAYEEAGYWHIMLRKGK